MGLNQSVTGRFAGVFKTAGSVERLATHQMSQHSCDGCQACIVSGLTPLEHALS